MQSVQYSAIFGDGPLGLVLRNVEGYAIVHSLYCEVSGEQGQAAEAGVTVGSQLIQVVGAPIEQQTSFEAITQCIRTARRPLRLAFNRLAGVLRPIPSRLPLVIWRGALQAVAGACGNDLNQATLGGASRAKQRYRPGKHGHSGQSLSLANGEAELLLRQSYETISGFEIAIKWTSMEYAPLVFRVLDVLTSSEIPRIAAAGTGERELLAAQARLGESGSVRVLARIATDVPEWNSGEAVALEDVDDAAVEVAAKTERRLLLARQAAGGEGGEGAAGAAGLQLTGGPLGAPGSASLRDAHWLTLACKTRGARADLRRSLLLRGLASELALQARGTGVARTVAQSRVSILQRGILGSSWAKGWVRLRSDGALQWWILQGQGGARGKGRGGLQGQDSESAAVQGYGLPPALLVPEATGGEQGGSLGEGGAAGEAGRAVAAMSRQTTGVLGLTASADVLLDACVAVGRVDSSYGWRVQPMLAREQEGEAMGRAADGGCCLPTCGVRLLESEAELAAIGAPAGDSPREQRRVVVITDRSTDSTGVESAAVTSKIAALGTGSGRVGRARASSVPEPRVGRDRAAQEGSTIVAFCCDSELDAAMWRFAAERQRRSARRGGGGSLELECSGSSRWLEDAAGSAEALAAYYISELGVREGRDGQKNDGVRGEGKAEGSTSSVTEAQREQLNAMSMALTRQLKSDRFVAAGRFLALSQAVDSRADLSAPILAVDLGLGAVEAETVEGDDDRLGKALASALRAMLLLQGTVSQETRDCIRMHGAVGWDYDQAAGGGGSAVKGRGKMASQGRGGGMGSAAVGGAITTGGAAEGIASDDSDDSDWELPQGVKVTPSASPSLRRLPEAVRSARSAASVRSMISRRGTLLSPGLMGGPLASSLTPLQSAPRMRSGSLVGAAAVGSPLVQRRLAASYSQQVLRHACSRLQPGSELYDPALVTCVRWRVLRQLRSLRERPSNMFSDPLRAFTLLLRAAGDLDQGAYASAIGTSADRLRVARCSTLAAGKLIKLPLFLGRPKGLRRAVLSGAGAELTGSITDGRSPGLDALVSRLDGRAISKGSHHGGLAASDSKTKQNSMAELAVRGIVHASAFAGTEIRRGLGACRRASWLGPGWWSGLRWGWAVLICFAILITILADSARGLTVGVWELLRDRCGGRCWTANDSSGGAEDGQLEERQHTLSGIVPTGHPDSVIWPAKDSLRVHWDVLSDSDSDLDDDLCADGDLPEELAAERTRVAADQVLRRHHFVQLVPRFLPILADHYTAGVIYDALVEGTHPIMIGSVVRAVDQVRGAGDLDAPAPLHSSRSPIRARWNSLPISWNSAGRPRSGTVPARAGGDDNVLDAQVDPTVACGSATDAADSDKSPRIRVSTSLERVLTYDQFAAFVAAMRAGAGVAHADWDELRDKLELDAREVLVRQEDYVQLVLTARARPPVYAVEGASDAESKRETKECLGWYEETLLAEGDCELDVLEQQEAKGGKGSSAAGATATEEIAMGREVREGLQMAGGGTAKDALAAYSWLLRGDASPIAAAAGFTSASLASSSGATSSSAERGPSGLGATADDDTLSVARVAVLRESPGQTAAIPNKVILAYRSAHASRWSLVAEVPAAPVGAWRHPEVEAVVRTELPQGRSSRSGFTSGRAPIGASLLNRGIAEWRQQRSFQRVLQRREIRRRQHKAEGMLLRDHNTFEGFGVLTDSEANSDREEKFGQVMATAEKELAARWSARSKGLPDGPGAGTLAAASGAGADTPTGPRRRSRAGSTATPKRKRPIGSHLFSESKTSHLSGRSNTGQASVDDCDMTWVPRLPFLEEQQAFVTAEQAASASRFGEQLRDRQLASIRVRGTLFVSDRASYMYTGDDTIVIPHVGVRETQYCEVEMPGVAYGTTVQDTGLHLDVNDVRLVSKEKPPEDGLTEPEQFFKAVSAITQPSQPPRHILLPRESYRTVRTVRRVRQRRQAEQDLGEGDQELAAPSLLRTSSGGSTTERVRHADPPCGRVPLRKVPIKAVVPGTVRPQATLIFSPLKDLLLSIGEERLGGRRRVVKEAIDELVAAEKLASSREVARSSAGLGDDLYDVQRGVLVPQEVYDRESRSATGALFSREFLAEGARPPMGAWRLRRLGHSNGSTDPDAEALRCATDALMQRDQTALRRIMKRRKWEEGSRRRRLQRFSALQLVRTRALLKVTGRVIQSLLMCTNSVQLQQQERSAFDAVVADANRRALLVQWASQVDFPGRVAALNDAPPWWEDAVGADYDVFDETAGGKSGDSLQRALRKKKLQHAGAIVAARRLLDSNSNTTNPGTAAGTSVLQLHPPASEYSGAGGRLVQAGGKGSFHTPEPESKSARSTPSPPGTLDQYPDGGSTSASGAEIKGFEHMTGSQATAARPAVNYPHGTSVKSATRLKHLAVISALSAPSPFLGLSKEASSIQKGATPPDTSGKWASRREQAIDGLRRAAAQAATVSSALVRCEEGGSRSRLASFAVETLCCEPEPTWLTHAAAFAAREEEAWKRRHAKKHTFEMDQFRHEWNTLISVLFKPFSRAWQTYKYIRGWENPALSTVFLISGLVFLWSDLTVHWPVMCLSLLFFVVLFNGALGRNQQDRLSEVLIEPNIMRRRSLYESYVSFTTSLGTGMFRMRAMNRGITKFHALLTWRRPERTRIFLVLLGMFILFLIFVPAKVWMTLLALQQFTAKLRDGGMGVQIVALSRFVDGLPAPSAAEALGADGSLEFPSHPGTVVSCIAADKEAEGQVGGTSRPKSRRGQM